MAINDYPDVRCGHANHGTEPPPAVGFIRRSTLHWTATCEACRNHFAAQREVFPFVDLAVARERRPATVNDVLDDLHRRGYAIVDRSDPDGSPDPLPC